MEAETAIAVTLLVAAGTLLAGCLSEDESIEQFAIDERRDAQATADAGTPGPIAYDGNRTPLDEHPLIQDPARTPGYTTTLVPGGGAEPNVGITSNGSMFVTTFDQTRKSTDLGRTWDVVWDFEPPGRPMTEDTFRTNDPMLWVDPTTDRIFTQHMHPGGALGGGPLCTYLAWSDDEGDTWTERPLACGIPELDHPKIATAPPGPDAPPQATLEAAYPNVLYLCVNKLDLGTWCSSSLDGGATFAYDRQAAPAHPDCGAINGHPHPYDDGTIVVPLGSFGSCERPVRVATSSDNGLSWQVRTCETPLNQTEIDPDITTTPDGTAYMLFRGEEERVHLARTTDKFQTCDIFDVAPPSHTLNVFTVITSGDDGRISMAYLGTDDEQYRGATPSNASGGTEWHLYVTTSIDADSPDPTFVTRQVTPEDDPVQLGCIWLQGGGGGPQGCRNLLDFIDTTHNEEGRVVVAYTDGCIPRNGCAQDPDEHGIQSRGRQVAVAVQNTGVSLFEDQGVLEPLNRTHSSEVQQRR